MKSIKSVVLTVAIVLTLSSCASFGVWSTTAQADITKVVAYYNQYLSGVLTSAPVILSEASLLLGSNNKTVQEASAAITGAQAAVAALNAAAQTATTTNTQEANVAAAITAVNSSVGAVKTAIVQAQGTSATK